MEYKFHYQLTDKAEGDLDDIVGYIAVALSNPKAAADFADKLQRAINEVRLFPESGSPLINDFLPNMDIRKKIIGKYIMYYRPDFEEKTIYILRIIYGSRNINEILQTIEG